VECYPHLETDPIQWASGADVIGVLVPHVAAAAGDPPSAFNALANGYLKDSPRQRRTVLWVVQVPVVEPLGSKPF
jgi:hypothetical protein